MGSTVIRAFPVNAATMGVVTLIMKTMSKDSDEVKVYDTMRRLRMAESLHVNLPPTVEKYFEKNRLTNTSFFFQNNISTMATDGPSIILIGKPDMGITMSRLYVEHTYYAMPSSYQPDEV